MVFDYFPVGSSGPQKNRTTPLELAKYLAFEWLPNVPYAAINGLTSVLDNALVEKGSGLNRAWHINPELANIDRQWRGFTSWMLGIVFTRHVMEEDGYPWRSPVSAFQGPTSSGRTTTGKWLVPLPKSKFRIERHVGSNLRLLPDYVVCGMDESGRLQYVFFESKGTKNSIGKWTCAPQEWSNQVNSGKLTFDGKVVPISSNVIVATRINPSAMRRGGQKMDELLRYCPGAFVALAALASTIRSVT